MNEPAIRTMDVKARTAAALSSLGVMSALPIRFTGMLGAGVASMSLVLMLAAQTAKHLPVQKRASGPVQAQSSSSISLTAAADGSQVLEIRNVSYEVTGTDVPGRPRNERLLLSKTTHSKETLGEIGVDATVLVEAWRFGDDLRQKPRYTISVSGTDGHRMDNAIFIASRGLEEVDWWSVYRLGTGQHLFDTYVPLVSFSISKEFVITRYIGLDVRPDSSDTRLKQPNVVAVLTYASADRVLREALLTCDDTEEARLLRSYADVTRSVSMLEGEYVPSTANAKPREPSRKMRLSFSENYPSPSNTKEVLIPLQNDDLDLTHAQLPARMHLSGWRR